jgi:hypothetical protein
MAGRVFGRLLILFLLCAALTACQGSFTQQLISESFPRGAEAYQPMGFNSSDEVDLFLPNYLYFAFRLSGADWRAFYEEFPEFWVDVQQSKKNAFFNDFNSGYTAYAFRWTVSNKAKEWPPATIDRLQKKSFESGDDLFKIIYALGAPNRIVWNNSHEVLLYKEGTAYLISGGRLANKTLCVDCCEEMSDEEKASRGFLPSMPGYTLSDNQVLVRLSLTSQ